MNTVQPQIVRQAIPMPAWAERRHEEDEGRSLVDESSFELGIFHLIRSQVHNRRDDGTFSTLDENVFVQWVQAWPSEPTARAETETFTLLPANVPNLIAALQRFQAEAGN